MRKYEEKPRPVLTDLLCDVCGKSCRTNYADVNFEYATLTAQWGYFSRKDGDNYAMELCEDCFDDVIKYLQQKKQISKPPDL